MRRIGLAGLSLLASACAPAVPPPAVPMPAVAGDSRGRTFSPAGPVLLVYRDSESNETRVNLVARYAGQLGRSPVVPFTIENLERQPACTGTFAAETTRNGRFTLSCFGGFLEGTGSYQVAPGDRRDQLVARGRSTKGQPIVLLVGRPTGAQGRL